MPIRVKRLTGMDNAIHQMQEFTHDGDDKGFASNTPRTQAVSEST